MKTIIGYVEPNPKHSPEGPFEWAFFLRLKDGATTIACVTANTGWQGSLPRSGALVSIEGELVEGIGFVVYRIKPM